MEISKYIDHTLLKPEATDGAIDALCKEAIENKFAAVCINPVYVHRASQLLLGTDVGVATVIGFPLGANTTAIKARETFDAIANGATEIDMVLAIGLFKSDMMKAVRADIGEVVKAAEGRKVKVILETCLLSNDEIRAACEIAADAGAAFVKTSTGFSTGGATVEAVRIMKETVGKWCEVKASGGIRNLEQAKLMIEAGATRLGTSAGVAIVKGLEGKSAY